MRLLIALLAVASIYWPIAVAETIPKTITATAPLSLSSNLVMSIPEADTDTDGYLSSTDWDTFNSKIGSLPLTTKGDLLVQIDDREIRSTINSLEETLKSQEADLKYTLGLHARNQAIFKVGGLAREKLEASAVARAGKQAAVKATRQKIEAQEIQLDYLNIRAPFDGTVGAIFLRKGNLATPGQPLLTLHSLDRKLTFSYVPDTPPVPRARRYS